MKREQWVYAGVALAIVLLTLSSLLFPIGGVMVAFAIFFIVLGVLRFLIPAELLPPARSRFFDTALLILAGVGIFVLLPILSHSASMGMIS